LSSSLIVFKDGLRLFGGGSHKGFANSFTPKAVAFFVGVE
jgi:hypothetical protein